MAIQINHNQGIYEIHGSILGKNTAVIEKHFNQVMKNSTKLVLCLDNVKRIDSQGVDVLTNLYKTAVKNNKILYIIGKENQKVNQAFGSVNYILKSDFI